MPDLSYPTKGIVLNINEIYKIDKSKIEYKNISNEHTYFVSNGYTKIENGTIQGKNSKGWKKILEKVGGVNEVFIK